MHPACPNKKQNHLQNSFLRRAQFWVRKTFSKPASLKKASLVLHGECHSLLLHKTGWFVPNGRLGVSPKLPQCVSCLRFHVFSVPHCVVRPLECVVIYFYWISFMSYSLSMSSSSWRLQIDEYNIAGRHHRCVVAIPLVCENLPEAHHHFVRWLCLALGRQLLSEADLRSFAFPCIRCKQATWGQ